jgi:small-conductance mechanosensitive channel
MDIGNSLQKAIDGFFAFLPNLVGFILILVIGFIVAKLVSAAARRVLRKLDMDRKLADADANKYVDRVLPGASPSNGIARVAFWLIFIFFLFSAVGALQIPAVTTFMNQVLAYLPNVIAAILIFALGAIIAGAVARAVARVMGETSTGRVVASVLPALVLVIAMFMILQQLQIAEEIVQIAFAATMGALALGLALAFGLGGRPVAQRMLEEAYVKDQEQRDQAKRQRQTADPAGQRPMHTGAASGGA